MGIRSTVPLLWLRDHCPCPKCLHPETRQRLSDQVAFDEALAARRISIAANAPELEIEWAGDDAHVSSFDAAWLRNATRLAPSQPAPEPFTLGRCAVGRRGRPMSPMRR